ncbi:MAG: regulatory protein RecX [Oscillospiraceae bacterium]|nr:regulatory protein RecX [Oscillospiraceae bacterium]
MKLESLTPIPGPTGRIRLKFDNGMTMKVYPEVVADCVLYAGREFSEEELRTLEDAARKASARQRAVRIVSASSVSEKELQRRLIQRGEREEDVQQSVEWLKDLNVLDDRQVAAEVVRKCIAKGYGPARARQELYGKGVPKDLWDEALADYPEMDDEIGRFLESRLHGERPDRKQVQQLTGALARRGHSYEAIRAALRKYTDELDEYEP